MSKTYKAMPGSIIIEVPDEQNVKKAESGLLIIQDKNKDQTSIATILSVGDKREDLSIGTRILFPTSTGMKIDKNIYYLKYEDICAIVVD